MAFSGTPDINFTAKTGVVQSGNDLTSWTDQITGVVLNSTTRPPQVSTAEQLNGINAINFESEDYITDTDSTYTADASGSNQSNFYFVAKLSASGSGFIRDARTARYRNAIEADTGQVRIRNASTEGAYVNVPTNEWGVLRAAFSDAGTEPTAPTCKIFWNDEIIYEDTGRTLNSSSGAGIVYGSDNSLSDFWSGFPFVTVQILEYANKPEITQVDHEQNLSEFETEWGLTLLPPYKVGPITKDGLLQSGVIVQVTAYDNDAKNSGKQDVGDYVTDVDGMISIPNADIPAGKTLFFAPHYKDGASLFSDQLKSTI